MASQTTSEPRVIVGGNPSGFPVGKAQCICGYDQNKIIILNINLSLNRTVFTLRKPVAEIRKMVNLNDNFFVNHSVMARMGANL
jgi:hypothetical protein